MDSMDSAIYIGLDGLFDYAAGAARCLAARGECTGRGEARRLQRAFHELKRAHGEISRRYAAVTAPPAACEWIMDNFYIIERECRAALPALERARALRRCADGALAAALCRNLLLSGLGEVTEERFKAYAAGFQSVTVLRRAELYLLPALLRAAVVESVAAVCREMRYAADTEEYSARLKALFTTLRLFAATDVQELISECDVTNAELCRDPTGDYARMDEGTKQAYLERVEQLARREGMQEHVFARRLIKRAEGEGKHVGVYLFPPKSAARARVYIAVNLLATLFLALFAAFRFESTLAALLLILPLSELIKSAADFALLHIVKPRRMFRMNVKNGVPAEGRTVCVISTLLGGEDDVRHLEELYFACRGEGEGLYFALLADLPTAESAEREEDAALLRQAREGITRLNRKHGGRFFLFTRPREFDGERYSARERKRGALMELAKLLCDEESALSVTGEKDALAGVRYILTLDADTRLYPGCAGELIGAMLHPLCRAVIDPRTKTVVSGHALIHPRIDTELESAGETDFALIFAGVGGSDPYGTLCGELYMDAFDCGGFAGKGIIDARALLKCTSHFPKGRVLSHDAPEGAYLRGAYMSDAELSDRFPSRPLAYYKRLHRWIRGDWQNILFIFAPGLRDIDRWRLADSLRRSLIAPATLAALVAGFFMAGAGVRVAAWAALCALLTGLFLSLAERGLSRRERGRRERRYARVLTGVGGAIVRTFIRLWLLPYEAWVAAAAILTAVWRMAVTHKGLLEWQTSAEIHGETGLGAHVRAMAFPLALGAALLWLCPSVIGKSAGLLWLLSPAAAFALALPARRGTELSEGERDYLINAAKRSFAYFADMLSPDDNFLPPDNFQEQPPVGAARRTSPTNIGLALAAHTAAADMGLISRGECAKYTALVLDTLERMPRHLGHFYNWYDTATLTPLLPAFISTVDSGNMYAGLLTTRQAMAEYGEGELAARIDDIMRPMSFAPLYDRARGLFHICYDTAHERGAGGWYDLMASEAMLTSYIAVAKGDVPVRHWRHLSRARLQKDGYRGLASWTGTMFEYLMPELFLPLYRGSLVYESVRFCLYAQKRRVWAGKPWGISESAFYSLDNALNYRYKAHGCPALALKRGQEDDLVISPYSSFLALAVDPESGIRNLRHLEALGAVGRWGFIEALDFTPTRCTRENGEAVRCYMAHHIGMSVIAAANAACAQSVQSRFMSAPEMAAFSPLIQERADLGGVILRRDRAEVCERGEHRRAARWQLRGGEHDSERRACILSNGAYSVHADNALNTRASYGGIAIYDCAPDLGAPGGVCIELENEGATCRLVPCAAPELWELEEDAARVAGTIEDVEFAVGAATAYGDCGEGRSVTLCAGRDMRVRLKFSFKPLLAPAREYAAHPAFWVLGLYAEAENGALILRRLRRGEVNELWLCAASNAAMEFSADENGALGALACPYVTATAELDLKAGVAETVRLALCVGASRADACEGAQRILVSGINDRGNMVTAAATHLGMSGEDVGAAMDMLTRLWPERVTGARPKAELWPHGISGDYPIICCDGRAGDCEVVLRRFCLLKSCGAECELVVLSDEQGEYHRPTHKRVMKALSEVGLEPLLGAPGGVHIAPMAAAAAVISRAAYTPGTKRAPLPTPPTPPAGAQRRAGAVPQFKAGRERFEFTVLDTLPARVWQNVLSNGSMGYIAADCGAGYMWYENAREMRINPPCGDANAVQGSETLYAELGGERISLFAANDGRECRVMFAPGEAVWEKRIGARTVRLTAFIARETEARVFIIEGAAGLRLGWTLALVLGAPDGKCVSVAARGDAVTASNPEAYLAGADFAAVCSLPCETACAYAPAAMTMNVLADEVTVLVCGVDEADELRALATPDAAFAALSRVRAHYARSASRFALETGCAPLDNYMSTWGIYQCEVCRLAARTSLYQSGGAIGFRDQLQDAVNLILIEPGYARERILDCCRHQYAEGDVMHWWHRHPQGDRGVRTRCSDDLLWLVWAVCEYTEKTGDYALCDEECVYLASAPLAGDERDRYETPRRAEVTGSVLDHAKRALERGIERGVGAHGLPKMGSGDWNDALDAVAGESVWLAWFFASCLSRFAALCDTLGAPGGERYRHIAAELASAAEKAWTGRRFLRGYFADGKALGGDERLDSVAQSWAVLSGMLPDSNRPRLAIDAALGALIDREHGLVKLCTPPYPPDSDPYPGYIVSYGEGFRENGGQYTHGAVWLAMAALRTGRTEEAWEILSLLLPENGDLRRYGGEPFVLAADVYSAPGHEGECGWSWYTGAAGWYFRAVTEELLGLKMRGGKLTISPRLPSPLRSCRVKWRDGHGAEHDIELRHGEVRVDGAPYHGGEIG